MQYRKKIRLIIIMAFVICSLSACAGKAAPGDTVPKDDTISWEALEAVKEASPDEIDSIRFTVSTEGGAVGDEITDADVIQEIYSLLCNLSLGKKTDMGVYDAGLYLEVVMGEEKATFDFELDILVLDVETRYEVNNLGPLKRYLQSLLPEE